MCVCCLAKAAMLTTHAQANATKIIAEALQRENGADAAALTVAKLNLYSQIWYPARANGARHTLVFLLLYKSSNSISAKNKALVLTRLLYSNFMYRRSSAAAFHLLLIALLYQLQTELGDSS